MMKHGSLFSGIGGFDLAAGWMGWDNVFHCEKDPFCRQVLGHYWPETESYGDIYQFNAVKYRGRIDIISGGFPCQPFSQAGRRKGKADDRYLWPETRRIIMEAQPRWIVLENVAGLFTILEPGSLSEMEVKAVELFCADGEQEANATIIRLQRRVIGSIISEIRSAGYILPRLEDGTPVVLCIPACAVGAPHRRDRVWFVAHAEHGTDRTDQHRPADTGCYGAYDEGRYAPAAIDQGRTDTDGLGKRPDTDGDRDGRQGGYGTDEIKPGKGGQYAQCDIEQVGRYVADTFGQGLEGKFGRGRRQPAGDGEIPVWYEWPTQSPVCGRNDGLPRKMDGITFPKWRTESIKAYGNAIVPQVALEIFRAIQAVETDGAEQAGHSSDS